jgi:concanavalin A-like lectin/glucanase superfamily protein
VTTWDANAKTRLGGTSLFWKGSMAEVQLWDRMISATEVFDLSDPIKVSKVAEWRMEEIGPGPAFDGSGFAHDLTFYNGALIPASGAGQNGTGLRLDGVDDYAAPGEAVLYTDQSFTVSAWVRIAANTSFETFLAQEGTAGQTNPGFIVYYDNANNQWKLKMYASPTADETTVTLAAGTATTPTAYHHLVGVFDAQRLELRLYVDNTLLVTRAMNAAWTPWNATGRFLIGSGQGGASPAFADMDEIRVYQGVVTDVTRIP